MTPITNTAGTYTAIVVMILAAILPRFGVTLDSATLTTVVQSIVVVASGIYVYYKHSTVVAAAQAKGIV